MVELEPCELVCAIQLSVWVTIPQTVAAVQLYKANMFLRRTSRGNGKLLQSQGKAPPGEVYRPLPDGLTWTLPCES